VVLALYAEQAGAGGFGRLAAVDLATELSRFVRVFLAGLRSQGDRSGA
jgi:hypothetical protein